MAKIRLLDKHTAELIAAGEVVERPASAAKELIENALDAGATQITVEIEGGGVSCLRVTDNGCGIAREDVETAFLRHATSKIAEPEDLDGISTLGFHGEALASVSAVSRVELLTRTADEMAGTHYLAEGGEKKVLEDVGCPQGTTIFVRDLFYNVPARMKFLKKDVSEGNAVAAVMDRMALSHPEVAFRFIREGRQELSTPGDGSIESAVYAVCGRDFTKESIPVSYRYSGIQVGGLVCRPSAARANRLMQFFFINGRFVKSKTVAAALEQAFKGSLMQGRFPACVLYLTMPFEVVDVNVHPAKIEVRFSNEKPIFDAVFYGVRSALLAGDAPKNAPLPPAVQTVGTVQPISAEKAAVPATEPLIPARRTTAAPAEAVPPVSFDFHTSSDPGKLYRARSVNIDILPENETPLPANDPPISAAPAEQADPVPEQTGAASADDVPLRLIGEAFATYILIERQDDLYMIDKHAAHERILYEKLRRAAHAEAQMLLFPLNVSFTKEEYTVLIEALPLLKQAGFDVEDFGAGTLLVRGLPMNLAQQDAGAVLQEIAGRLQEGKRDITTEKLDWIYHSVACRAAVKAGDVTPAAALESLAKQVLDDPQLRYCPHGRPVCVHISRKDVEKMFGRIV
ncbi:MAG: DNA mismatch repair endonuclease MutL [Clostridia bacterium]|nr:DNA mismatch repair endonuclease MutL [Clostridia bacterium]